MASSPAGDLYYLNYVKGTREPKYLDFDPNSISPEMTEASRVLAEDQERLLRERNALAVEDANRAIARGTGLRANSLAMRGGLGQGTGERMSQEAARQNALSMGRLGREGMLASQSGRLDIGARDLASRLNAGQMNTAGRNAFNMAQYRSDNELLGARNTAEATREQARAVEDSGWSWFCTKAHDLAESEDLQKILRTLTRKFKVFAMKHKPEQLAWYIKNGSEAARKSTKEELEFVKTAMLMLGESEEKAFDYYEKKALELIAKYTPNLEKDYKNKFLGGQ